MFGSQARIQALEEALSAAQEELAEASQAANLAVEQCERWKAQATADREKYTALVKRLNGVVGYHAREILR